MEQKQLRAGVCVPAEVQLAPLHGDKMEHDYGNDFILLRIIFCFCTFVLAVNLDHIALHISVVLKPLSGAPSTMRF